MRYKWRDLKGAFFFSYFSLSFFSHFLCPQPWEIHPRLPARPWINIRSWLLAQSRWVKRILPEFSFYQAGTGPGNVSLLPLPSLPAMENPPWRAETLSRRLPLGLLLLAGLGSHPRKPSDIAAFRKHTWNSISWVPIGSFLLLFVSSRYSNLKIPL